MNATNDQSIDEYLGADANKPLWKKPIFYIPALLILLLLIAYLALSGGSQKVDYITEDVEARSLDLVVTATGNLRPTNQVEVGSEVSGRIDAVLADVNDVVTRGQILARINTDVIQDQITQGRASLDASRAAVLQAEATLNVDTAQLNRLLEVQRLSDGRVPSRSELESAEAAVQRGRASVASARANVTSSQASLSSTLTNRDRAVIRSPVSGVVLARQVETGQTVAASFNTPTLFVLAEDLVTMQLRVKVDEADVGQVETGQTANFTVDAYPGRQFPATVERVDLASGNISNTETTGQGGSVVEYESRLTVDNTEGLLRPGMTATANISTLNTGSQMTVPNGALRFEPPVAEQGGGIQIGGGGNNFGLEREEETATVGAGSRQTVYVLDADDNLKSIVVTTGLSDGRHTVVTSEELEVGMSVVTAVRAQAE